MKKEADIEFTKGQIMKKFFNLWATYKRIKKRNCESGYDATYWEFFDEFDEVYGSRHSINPPSEILANSSTHSTEIGDDENAENDPELAIPRKKTKIDSLDFLKEQAQQDEKRHQELPKVEEQKIKLEERRLILLESIKEMLQNIMSTISST